METETDLQIQNLPSETAISHYKWQLDTDSKNSIWELQQTRTFILITAATLQFAEEDQEKHLNLVNALNHMPHYGFFNLRPMGMSLLQTSNFYHSFVYQKEELAALISGMISRLSLYSFAGDSVFNQGLQAPEAVEQAVNMMNKTRT